MLKISPSSKKIFHFSVLLTFSILFFLQADSGTELKSATFDEMAHLTAGVSYLKTGDFRLNPENGVIPQVLAALPVYLKGYSFPEPEGDLWKHRVVWYLGDQFFHYLKNDLHAMLSYGRRMIIFSGILLGFLIYFLSTRMFGIPGGVISLILYLFSPDILAHSGLITSDITVTLMFLITLFSIWQLFHKISFFTLAASGISLSLLFLSKMSAVLILPTALILMIVHTLSDKPIVIEKKRSIFINSAPKKNLCFFAIILLNIAIVSFSIWAVNGFEYSRSYGAPPDYPWDETLTRTGALRPALSLFRSHKLLPESYLYGFTYVISEASERPAFLNGEFRTTGWWYFFLYCFFVKTPISTMFILLVSFVCIVKRKNFLKIFKSHEIETRQNGLTLPLCVFFCVYLLFAITGNLNLGVRHIIPIHAVLFIFGGGASLLIQKANNKYGYVFSKRTLLLLIPVVGLIIESISVRPHYLAFFNAFSGGPKEGYKHLVDSSLDWGQDLPSLKIWIDKERARGNEEPLFLSFFGTANPDYYAVKNIRLPGHFDFGYTSYKSKLTGGLYAISATMLQNIYNPLTDIRGPYWYPEWEKSFKEIYQNIGREKNREKWEDLVWRYNMYRFAKLTDYLRKISPFDQIGYSILLYRVSQKEINDLFGDQTNLEIEPGR